ncbi:MAG: hypothetical protein ACRCY3_08855, partial [Sphingorhabdus sp.]
DTGPRGTMVVKDFDRGAGRVFSQPGDLGISLDDFNPLALLSLIAPRLAGVPIAQSHCVAVAANDNLRSAWPGRPFRLSSAQRSVSREQSVILQGAAA